MSYFQAGWRLKKWDEKTIIRSSHQTDVVIKSEDIKKIPRDHFILM